MTQVKICGLTSVQDALWAARCGADLLGMIYAPHSPRTVTLSQAAAIAGAVREAGDPPLLVGVFVNQDISYLREAYSQCTLDLVQLHGNESPAYVEALGLPHILARRMGEPGTPDRFYDYAPWAFLLDSYDPQRAGGTGRTWRWENPRPYLPVGRRWILAGGLTLDNVQEAIATAHPWGVDVSSGVEARPGQKDPGRVAALIERVKEIDRHDHP